MGEKSMGRKKVPTAEAAKLLGVTKRSLTNYTAQGLLSPETGKGGAKSYYVDELSALKEVLSSDRGAKDLALRVMLNEAMIRTLTKRLRDVESVLGFDLPVLSYEKEDVLALYWLAEDLASNPIHEADVVRDFVKTLLAMQEEFLKLVELHAEDREPWRIFLEAADALQQRGPEPGGFKDQELAATQAQLQVARSMFEQRAIQYVRRRDGERASHWAFPKTEPCIHKRILARLPTPDRRGPGTH